MTLRTLSTFTLLVALGLAAGWWGRGHLGERQVRSMDGANASGEAPCPDGATPLYWKAPMDPTFVRDRPGKSPMGMDLVPECPTAGAAAAPAENAVVIDATTLQNMGVRTARVERRTLSRSVRAVGRVDYDERRVTHVHTKVRGWVERLFVDFEGQRVERGRPLLEIYSPELVATQEELLVAARYRGVTSSSPFDDVRSGGQSLFEAAQRRLALWDVSDRDVSRLLESGVVRRSLTLDAPASGVVSELGVRAGMAVEPGTRLYTIADLSKVWLLAEVYEYELPWIEVGQQARVTLPARPGQALEAELTYIAPYLDPKTRTVEVRLELDNAEGRLKPAMYAEVAIAAAPRPRALAIPSEAVLRSGTRTLAIVARGGGRFEPREVELGLETGAGRAEVVAGLEEGEEVVVSGQFLIDSESRLQEAVRRLLPKHTPPDTPSRADGAHEQHETHASSDPHAGHETHEASDPHAGHETHEASAPHTRRAHPTMGGE